MYLKRGTFVRAFVLLATSAAFLIADAHAAPKDPPVTSGGEGPTGNDWTDYGYASPSTLYYRRNGENYRVTNHTTVYISTTNSNFNLNHCRISTPVDVAKVSHYHFAKDYGDNFGGANGVVTAQERVKTSLIGNMLSMAAHGTVMVVQLRFPTVSATLTIRPEAIIR